ncbi:MAG: redox-sensitive transcriptional activator SoxR, partial [Pseudomonadota bacterium]
MKEPHLAIGQLAKRSGIAVSAIRYYADAGLLPARRSAGGTRQFPRSTLRRLGFIRITQQLGYSLETIGTLLRHLPHERTPTQADWRRLASRIRRDLDARIDALERTRDALDGCIEW